MKVVHPGSFQPGCYSHRSATSDLLGAHCTAVQLNGLLLGLSRSLALLAHYRCVRSSCLLNICHPAATLHYATSCTTGPKPGGKMCDAVTDVRFQSAPLH